MGSSPEVGWVTLARLVKTQGRKGELAAEVLSDIPGRFAELHEVWLRGRNGERRSVHITRQWPHAGMVVFGFDEIGDMNTAEAWVGAELQVPRERRAEAPPGEYFHSDLEGCAVTDGGRELGTVTAVETIAGGTPLLRVAACDGRTILIPFAASYVERVALAERRLEMRLPEGLTELND